jgi:hypothetical protein
VSARHDSGARLSACTTSQRQCALIRGAGVQVARDIDLVREGAARSTAPYAEGVQYSDGLLARFSGKANFRAFEPAKALLTKTRANVTSMAR